MEQGMAQVNCVSCGRYADDMDGACLHCGKSVFGDVKDTFDNGPVSSSGRAPLTDEERWRILRDLDNPVHVRGSTLGNFRPKGVPLRPVNTPGAQDWSWLEDSNRTISDAQDLYYQTMGDWEKAVKAAEFARDRLTKDRLAERVLGPAERHEFVQRLAAISFADAAWKAYKAAEAKYFRLLNEFAEAEKTIRSAPLRGGLEDPLDPYRNTNRDDGSLRFVQRQADRARADRRRDGGARGFSLE
jgi:hypothetical protein